MLSEYEGLVEEHEGGKLVIFERNSIFQARIYRSGRSYIYKSLNTRDLGQARKQAIKLWHEFQFKAAHGLPVTTYTMSQAAADVYVYGREEDSSACIYFW